MEILPNTTVLDVTTYFIQVIQANIIVIIGVTGLALGIVFVMSFWKKGISLTDSGLTGDSAWTKHEKSSEEWDSLSAEEWQERMEERAEEARERGRNGEW